MATPLFDSTDKQEINEAFKLIHDTFKKTIKVYHEAKKTITPNMEHNAIYGRAGATENITYETISYEISAEVNFEDSMDRENVVNGNKSVARVDLPDGSIKVTVYKDDLNTIQKAKRIEYLNKRYHRISDLRPQGFFDPEYYSFYAEPIE